ncbi:MAG: xanthine dehydrogenase family protein molybdopterin-binding subunit [Proteobacteria bacterium]|nr:xanthine dehydrogenase family protein molybdopterin-binding subunit [Pseudomonadota bacterium]
MTQNTSAWRNDALAKVTGKAKYADDYKFYEMLHVVPVYTEEVSAEVLAIHTDEAARMPGVVRVVTYRDVPGKVNFGQIQKDYQILASDRIRMHGDVVALVVAQTRAQALAAAACVKVDCKPLPAIFDPEEGYKDNFLIHPDKGTNLINHHAVRTGNAQEAFKSCDFVLEEIFTTQHQEHAYIEPESSVAVPDDDGVIRIYGSMQHPFVARRFTACLLGEPFSNIEVFTIAVGGGFGGKDDTAALVAARAALCARLTNRPCKLTYDREWSMRESYKRHAYKVYYKMGFSGSGLIQACDVTIFADGGAYCSVTPWVTWRSTVQCCGPYCVPNVHCDTYGVHTNNIFTGAFRGFGSPQMNFIVEQMVEKAAQTLGMDEIEFRRLNMVKQGSTTITQQKLDGHTVSMAEVLDTTLAKIDYYEKRKRNTYGVLNETGEYYAVGLAMSYRGMSLGAEGIDICAAIINAQYDGSILIETGIHENGQGSEAAMILMAAECLGVCKDRIRYRRSSTSSIPDSGTTVASRGTLMGTSAIVLACNKLKEQMARVLSESLKCQPKEVRFENDGLCGPNHTITWDEAVWTMFLRQEHPYAMATFQAPEVSWDEETGHGNAYFTWVYGCQAVEIAIQPKTGKIRLLSAAATHDVGKAVNPPFVLGQIYGGMAQGYGYATMEDLGIKNGKVTNLNLGKYKIPKATDVPDFIVTIVENPDPLSKSHAKGIGEPALELMAPAVANAVFHATGQRCQSLPVTVTPQS